MNRSSSSGWPNVVINYYYDTIYVTNLLCRRSRMKQGCGQEMAECSAREPGWYERKVLPYLIDWFCGSAPISRQRQKVVPLARGRVLEVGMGTGLNLAHYDQTRIQSLTGLDPALAMNHLARKRAQRTGLAVELLGLEAERIPMEDATFDSVVVTFALCTIKEPQQALQEMRRVLKPEGQLLFCEHGMAPDPGVRRWQDRIAPIWSALGGGCQINRDIPGLLQEAGFRLADLKTAYLPGLRPVNYHYWGVAQP